MTDHPERLTLAEPDLSLLREILWFLAQVGDGANRRSAKATCLYGNLDALLARVEAAPPTDPATTYGGRKGEDRRKGQRRRAVPGAGEREALTVARMCVREALTILMPLDNEAETGYVAVKRVPWRNLLSNLHTAEGRLSDALARPVPPSEGPTLEQQARLWLYEVECIAAEIEANRAPRRDELWRAIPLRASMRAALAPTGPKVVASTAELPEGYCRCGDTECDGPGDRCPAQPTGQPEGTCALCGEPLPPGEEMFKYHGYSGPCPKPTGEPEGGTET